MRLSYGIPANLVVQLIKGFKSFTGFSGSLVPDAVSRPPLTQLFEAGNQKLQRPDKNSGGPEPQENRRIAIISRC